MSRKVVNFCYLYKCYFFILLSSIQESTEKVQNNLFTNSKKVIFLASIFHTLPHVLSFFISDVLSYLISKVLLYEPHRLYLEHILHFSPLQKQQLIKRRLYQGNIKLQKQQLIKRRLYQGNKKLQKQQLIKEDFIRGT